MVPERVSGETGILTWAIGLPPPPPLLQEPLRVCREQCSGRVWSSLVPWSEP